ncbi:protocadherin alpha-1-like X1 [Biomphalaria pfeifferi]|uniref:Protocadherin alpha-1-like X1 n=1 Tax=Biomphalaria pfeifferi TaxID=112525 RepID=A0AAD8BS07_BIOPF|nr:protocadherin alpha-1-like X1 [Biomphalaria pfeifferi]
MPCTTAEKVNTLRKDEIHHNQERTRSLILDLAFPLEDSPQTFSLTLFSGVLISALHYPSLKGLNQKDSEVTRVDLQVGITLKRRGRGEDLLTYLAEIKLRNYLTKCRECKPNTHFILSSGKKQTNTNSSEHAV